MKIKLCPFCGKKPEMVSFKTRVRGLRTFRHRIRCEYGLCVISPSTYFYAERQNTIKIWNKRHCDYKGNQWLKLFKTFVDKIHKEDF